MTTEQINAKEDQPMTTDPDVDLRDDEDAYTALVSTPEYIRRAEVEAAREALGMVHATPLGHDPDDDAYRAVGLRRPCPERNRLHDILANGFKGGPPSSSELATLTGAATVGERSRLFVRLDDFIGYENACKLWCRAEGVIAGKED